MSFDWSQYLTLAKELAGEATILAEGEARLRDAISRSYYAAFINDNRGKLDECDRLFLY
jgi:hypothetical protein